MKTLLSGNEAIARGAYEYGVQVATGYPGTPSSEILENIATYDEIYSEWSVNEKVAMDVAIGAAYAGRRAVVTMKQVGMNVAADSFFYPVYTGVKGGLLIVTADDPGMFSSQNEQDNRHYARFAKMPMLEPSNSQEAKDFVGIGLDLSEEWDTPVLLRTVMRVSHSASPVELGERRANEATPTPPLERDPHKLVSTCLWARERHPVVEARLKELAERASTYPFNRLEWGEGPHSRLGIVASGPVYHYAREIWPEASFLKLGLTYPLPTALIQEFAEGVEELLIIEELDPFLEEQIALLLKHKGITCRGKDIFPACGELTTPVIERSAAEAGILPWEVVKGGQQVAPSDLPGRPPVFCPGCPHRSTFYILSLSRMKDVVVAGDIGCYNLGALPPFNATDTMGAMGASVGVAHGFDVGGIPDRFVAVIGDSTFFHAGIAPLLNIVHNGGKSTVVILDNQTTAMTGHQDHPGVGVKLGGEPVTKVEIEDIVRASGVTDVHKVSAFDVQAVEGAFKQALAFDGPSVVIVEGPCFFVGPGAAGAYDVDSDACTACGQCFRMGCPAIVRSNEMHVKTGKPKAKIDPVLCVGCDMCAQICPSEAIHPSTGSGHRPAESATRPRQPVSPQSANPQIRKSAIRNPLNFLITGVGGQGTVLASDIMAAVGLAAGYDVKKSDILGLAVRGGGVVGHVRWGEQVHSPIVPEGRVDYLVAFEILEGLRWLNQMRPEGTILINQQEIHPVTVSSGVAVYPNEETAEGALSVAAEQVYRIPGLGMAQELGDARVLNVVLLGALSALLPVESRIWEGVLKERVPSRFVDLNLRAFHTGREWMQGRLVG